jgi:hypothetical protein
VRSDHDTILTTTSAAPLMLLERIVLAANGQKIRERLWHCVFFLLRFERQRLEEQFLIGAGHVALATRAKECLLEDRQLLASLIKGELQRRNLLLLNGD